MGWWNGFGQLWLKEEEGTVHLTCAFMDDNIRLLGKRLSIYLISGPWGIFCTDPYNSYSSFFALEVIRIFSYHFPAYISHHSLCIFGNIFDLSLIRWSLQVVNSYALSG